MAQGLICSFSSACRLLFSAGACHQAQSGGLSRGGQPFVSPLQPVPHCGTQLQWAFGRWLSCLAAPGYIPWCVRFEAHLHKDLVESCHAPPYPVAFGWDSPAPPRRRFPACPGTLLVVHSGPWLPTPQTFLFALPVLFWLPQIPAQHATRLLWQIARPLQIRSAGSKSQTFQRHYSMSNSAWMQIQAGGPYRLLGDRHTMVTLHSWVIRMAALTTPGTAGIRGLPATVDPGSPHQPNMSIRSPRQGDLAMMSW